MEELKKIAIKFQRDTLSDVVRAMKEKQDEGIIINFEEMMEITNSLSDFYGK